MRIVGINQKHGLHLEPAEAIFCEYIYKNAARQIHNYSRTYEKRFFIWKNLSGLAGVAAPVLSRYGAPRRGKPIFDHCKRIKR